MKNEHEHAVFVPGASAFVRVGDDADAGRGRAIAFGPNAESVNGFLVDVLNQMVQNGSLTVRSLADARVWGAEVLASPTERDVAFVDEVMHMVPTRGAS